MSKRLGLVSFLGYLAVACPSPAAAGWDEVYASAWDGARFHPTVVSYGQYAVEPIRWRVYPRYFQTLYVPAGYRSRARVWLRGAWR